MIRATFFPKLLSMSLTASVVIVVVLLLRLLLKKAPKAVSYAMWSIVLIRLLCPVSVGSGLSLFGLIDTPVANRAAAAVRAEFAPDTLVRTEQSAVALPVSDVDDGIRDALPQEEKPPAADPRKAPAALFTYVWIAGLSAMCMYAAVSCIRIRRKLLTASLLRDNIYLADGIATPFVMGLIRPKIYLPSSLEEREQSYILMHEQHHIRRGDHLLKALAFAALCIHWFNPLVWVAFMVASKDMEMSCDEAVIGKMGDGILADYSASLLTLATGRRVIAGMPLAFGEGDTKGRIRNLATWKKPALWITLAAVIVCVIVAVCLLTDPKNDEPDLSFLNVKNLLSLIADTESVQAVYYPPADSAGNGEIRLGTVNGSALAKYLDLVSWQKWSAPEEGLSSPGSIEFRIDGSTRITIYQKPRWAKVTWLTDERYYKTHGGDYDAAVKLFTAENASKAVKWFDCVHGDEMVWDGVREISLPEFEGVTFRWFSERVEAVTEKETVPLYYGMPVWSVYFCDLTGDGKPELCSTLSIGSGIIDDRVMIYDYANGVSYEKIDRGSYDYALNMLDGRLLIEKRAYGDSELLETGELVFRDGTLQIVPVSVFDAGTDVPRTGPDTDGSQNAESESSPAAAAASLLASEGVTLALYPAPDGQARPLPLSEQVRNDLLDIIRLFRWTELKAPSTEPSDYWLSADSEDGGVSLTFWSDSGAGTVSLRDGERTTFWRAEATGGSIYPSVANAAMDFYYQMDSDWSRIAFRCDGGAAAAAEQFVTAEYGNHMLSLAPGNPSGFQDYDVAEWSVLKMSEEDDAVVGDFSCAFTPMFENSVNIWAGNTTTGSGEYEGKCIWYRQFVLQLQEDGYWHCTDLGTGGASLP